MERRAFRAVVDLMAAAGAGRGEHRVLGCGPDGGEEDLLADGHGYVEVVIPERTRHAATPGGDDLDAGARDELKGVHGGLHTDQRLLVAVTV